MERRKSFGRWSAVFLLLWALPLGAAAAEAADFGTSVASIRCGDCSGDGRLDILDVLRAAQHLMTADSASPILISGRHFSQCDINSDHRVDMIDVMRINRQVLRSQGAVGSPGEAGEFPCAISSPVVPLAVVGVYFEYSLAAAAVPSTAEVEVVGDLPSGLSFKPERHEISGVPLGVGDWSFELDLFARQSVPGEPEGGASPPGSETDPEESEHLDLIVEGEEPLGEGPPTAETPQGEILLQWQLAFDLRVVSVAHPARLQYERSGPEALVISTLVESTGGGSPSGRNVNALAVTPASWRSGPSGVVLLMAVEDSVEAVVTTGQPGMPGVALPVYIGGTGRGVPMRGLAFHGEHCYAVDAGGTLYIATRSGGSYSLTPIAVLSELEGATSLLLQDATAESSAALVATIADPMGTRQVVRVPLSLFGEPASGEGPGGGEGIQVLSGASGAAITAAFARSEADSESLLYVRRQPDQLALFSFDPSRPTPRFALPYGLLPQVSALDSMVSVRGPAGAGESGRGGGTHLILSSQVDPELGPPLEGTGSESTGGVWILPFDGTYRLERLIGGFGAQPAGALARGPATLGTGTSLFVAGRGKIYEVFGKLGSATFEF